jgi:hypothetical protein
MRIRTTCVSLCTTLRICACALLYIYIYISSEYAHVYESICICAHVRHVREYV